MLRSSSMDCGFLLAADGPKYVNEALINARLLRKHSKFPIALAVSENNLEDIDRSLFDEVIFIENSKKKKFAFKILAMMQTPFEKTLYVDTDALVIQSVDHIFQALNRFEIGITIESTNHTVNEKVFPLKYHNVVPEWNSGILLYRKTENVLSLFRLWLKNLNDGIVKFNNSADMPYLREAFLSMPSIDYFILPNSYNLHGLRSFQILYGKIYIIHERMGRSSRFWTPVLLDVGATERLGKKLNAIHHKRLYIPYIGVISSRWSPGNIIDRIKMRFLPRVSRYTGEIVK